MRHHLITLLLTLLAPALLVGCEGATEDAEPDCAAQLQGLDGVCPAGTRANLYVSGPGDCQGASADGEVTDAHGLTSGVCLPRGSCQVFCEEIAALGCPCGLERVSAESFTCRAECPSICGDGEVSAAEECDLGAMNGTGRGCSNTCTIAGQCDEPGASRCVTPTQRIACTEGVWTRSEDCAESQRRCLDGQCAELSPDQCVIDGEERCVGTARVMCQHLEWVLQDDCSPLCGPEGACACIATDEVCDGIDNDCDGTVDEGCGDCTEEVCDGIDNDCDGQIDEDCVG